MNERILRVVEFDKIKQRLLQHAETTLGKKQAENMLPDADFNTVIHLLNETDEAMQVVRLNKTIPLGGIFDIEKEVKRSTIGSTLSTNECIDIASTIRGGSRVKQFIENLYEDTDIELLFEMTNEIMPLKDLQRQIYACIDENGEMLDAASTALRNIRTSIRTFESRIRERLDHYLKSNSNMLSDAIVTIRNDRYVLPVKSEYRAQVGGIVHDQSSSGQTLFMEPRQVVEANNKLQESVAKEKQEIERILKELTEQIAHHAEYLTHNVNILAKIDFIYARAKLAASMQATKPTMNQDGYISMKEARHPLIPKEDVVPNDIELGKDYQAIVITGPNTGGKTVTLKLIGLCTLMAQSGLFVPALDGLELAVFKEVFADIGDEQSIEQNLSTFSSHMTHIVDVLNHFDEHSLVLFDELGAGTDPQEGAALAMSILDYVIAKGTRVVATTHYPELKAYGFNREKVTNASVEFNVETLQPTYRLLIGVPGRSNAFEISRRLGLSNVIINEAKTHIGIESEGIENMIASLDHARKEVEKDYEMSHEVLLEAEELQKDLNKQWKKFENERERLYKLAEEKAEKALEEARLEATMIVEDMRKMQQEGMKEHVWIEAKKMLEEAQPNLAKKKTEQINETTNETKTLQVGDEVQLLKLHQKGIIAEKIDDRTFMVQVGAMKVKTKRKELEFIKRPKEEVEKPVTRTSGTKDYVPAELDLRGERYEDALLRVEKYIDDCVLAGLKTATIIHGKGTGALRNGVQELVKTHPNIKNARPGKHGEGDSGVTVVELR